MQFAIAFHQTQLCIPCKRKWDSCRDVFIIVRHTCILVVNVTIARSTVSFLQKMLATVVAQKGGLPMCARMGAIIDGLGLGVSSGFV